MTVTSPSPMRADPSITSMRSPSARSVAVTLDTTTDGSVSTIRPSFTRASPRACQPFASRSTRPFTRARPASPTASPSIGLTTTRSISPSTPTENCVCSSTNATAASRVTPPAEPARRKRRVRQRAGPHRHRDRGFEVECVPRRRHRHARQRTVASHRIERQPVGNDAHVRIDQGRERGTVLARRHSAGSDPPPARAARGDTCRATACWSATFPVARTCPPAIRALASRISTPPSSMAAKSSRSSKRNAPCLTIPPATRTVPATDGRATRPVTVTSTTTSPSASSTGVIRAR